MRKYLGLVVALCLVVQAGALSAQDDTVAPFGVGTSLRYSQAMLDRQDNVTDKVAVALRARQSGALDPYRLYVGGRLVWSNIWERTNTAGKFPILSRLPPTHSSGTSDSYEVVNEATLNATLVLPMVTAFVQGEYTELAYPGQSSTQIRKYWVSIGDLDRSPFYLAAGRKTVNFGNFATYAPLTHSHSTHYFWAQSDKTLFEFGYVTDDTELAFTLLPAHRGLRVLSSPDNDGDYENFAINGSHRFAVGNGMTLRLGGGFLRGTIYDSAIAHHPPGTGTNRKWNGAYDLNATLSGARFDLAAEFTKTTGVWPATGHKVSALSLQGRYRARVFGKPATYSLSLSRGVQGPSGSEWERMTQAIAGLEIQAAPNMTFALEYMFNDGFVPLIMPTVVADSGVKSHTVIAGIKLTF